MNGTVDQLPRLLALVPYLLARPGVRVADVAATFGVTEERLNKNFPDDSHDNSSTVSQRTRIDSPRYCRVARSR